MRLCAVCGLGGVPETDACTSCISSAPFVDPNNEEKVRGVGGVMVRGPTTEALGGLGGVQVRGVAMEPPLDIPAAALGAASPA